MKTLNTKSIKTDLSVGGVHTTDSKYENKENDCSQSNTNPHANKASAGSDSQKNIKPMNGIK